METAELEYRLLKDGSSLVVASLIKNGKQTTKSISEGSTNEAAALPGMINDIDKNYFFTASDYLSVIDHLTDNR